jgi:hypothetical protein
MSLLAEGDDALKPCSSMQAASMQAGSKIAITCRVPMVPAAPSGRGMLAVRAGGPLDPNQSADRNQRYNETMSFRNPQNRGLLAVLLVLALGVRGGMPLAVATGAGEGPVFVEVCTQEGLKRVPIGDPVPDGHGMTAACHAMACSLPVHGTGDAPSLSSLTATVAPLVAACRPDAAWSLPARFVQAVWARGPPAGSGVFVAQ